MANTKETQKKEKSSVQDEPIENTNKKIEDTDESLKGKLLGKRKDSSSLMRHLVGVIILAVVMLFAIPAGLNPSYYSNSYNYFFLAVLSLLLVYGIFEIVNFVFPFREQGINFAIFFIYLSVIYMILFIFMGVFFYQNFDPYFYQKFDSELGEFHLMNTSSHMIKRLFEGITFLIFFTLLIVLATSLTDIKITDVFVLLFVTLIFALFLLSIITMLAIFNWAFFLFAILATAATDTFAYIGGKKFGKRKLAPEVSPNKTVEGGIAGAVAGFVIAFLWYFAIILPTNATAISQTTNIDYNFSSAGHILGVVLISLLIPFIAQLGDLVFSKIKRTYDKKNFSDVLPHHGGLFDRIDSHIFTMIFTNLLLIIIFI